MSEQVGGIAHGGAVTKYHFHRGSNTHKEGWRGGEGRGGLSLKKESNGNGL